MIRKTKLFKVKVLVCLLMLSGSAYLGHAQCLSQGGLGDNAECTAQGSCGLLSWCIHETCSADGGMDCWPGMYIGCVVGGCANPFQGNCTTCVPTG